MAEDKERSHSSHKCCAAAQSINRSDNRKDLTFHAFPQDQDQRKIWMAKMKRGDQKFTSNISLFCCSAHFTAKDYRSSLTGKRRDLIKNAVPSIFPWTEDYDKEIRTERSERANVRDSKKLQLSVAPGVATDSVNTAEKEEAKPQEIEERDLVAEICELTQKVFLLKFGLERFSSNDDDIFFYTGFSSYETLLTFWNFVKPSAESLLSWNQARSKVNGELEDTAFPYLQGQKKEKQRTREIEPIDQLWMFLSRMRLGLFERDLAHRFNVSVGTVSDIVITWANYLYLVLGSLPIWPSKDKIKQHLPESFKGRYESVRGILDCTELKCELPKDYQKHSEMYSDYKSHDTFKGLICISPSGWITFVSQLYPGRISDKEVVEKSNFCQLIEPGDQYLADKGFEIHDLIALRGGSLYIPPKRFSVFDQFTESQCFETMSIANVRIHVERAIKRIKAWNIFNQVLPLSSFGSINQIWTVCALLVNFQNPIISV